MNGAISIQSQVNEGAVFQVCLPHVEIVESQGKTESALEPKMHIRFHDAIVLLAEDDEPSRVLIRDYLTSHHLRLIEDNAHGHGASVDGKPLGTWGDVGI